MAGGGSGPWGEPARGAGWGGVAGWGTVAGAVSAPETEGQAGAGPPGGPGEAVCLVVGVEVGPLCVAPSQGPEKALVFGALQGAVGTAAGPEGRGL